MKFIIRVSMEWTEYGEVVIDAEDEDEAREKVTEMLMDGDESIVWEGDNMQPGNKYVDFVAEDDKTKNGLVV